jgi:putative transposase
MKQPKCTAQKHKTPDQSKSAPAEAIIRSMLDEVIQRGARKMLQHAIEEEVTLYLLKHQHLRDDHGHRLVVRNGHQPDRPILTGVGPLTIARPRVYDRRPGCGFSSRILPSYMRRSPSLDALIPVLYLKGISTGDFTEALEAILGPQVAGLSPATIVRLKEQWLEEYDAWTQRDLSQTQYVYLWADGIYFNVRLEDDRPCMLVIMGVTHEGRKELVGLLDGERESILSWKELLLDLKRRGLRTGPQLAVADGALGFWPALEEVYGSTRQQRCWVHKTANVLDKLPKSVQAQAKRHIQDIYLAPTKRQAHQAYETFLTLYESKYPKACLCLSKDRDLLFTFYDYPADHWQHLRTTNPIESTFATIRHRTRQTKGCGSRDATLMMVYKLGREAEKHWRRINGYELIHRMLDGQRFADGAPIILHAA